MITTCTTKSSAATITATKWVGGLIRTTLVCMGPFHFHFRFLSWLCMSGYSDNWSHNAYLPSRDGQEPGDAPDQGDQKENAWVCPVMASARVFCFVLFPFSPFRVLTSITIRCFIFVRDQWDMPVLRAQMAKMGNRFVHSINYKIPWTPLKLALSKFLWKFYLTAKKQMPKLRYNTFGILHGYRWTAKSAL